jgi:dolichol kinase
MALGFLREVGRKTIHMLMLLVLIGYWAITESYGKNIALMSLVFLLILILIMEYLRLDLETKMHFLDFIIRPKERTNMLGAVCFVAASIICLAIFDFRIALTALLMATFGDMFAAIMGQRYGRTLLFKKKTLVGGISEAVVNLIIGIIVLINYTNIYTIIAMALTATISEILVEEIDDNIVIPIFAGFVGQLLMFL